MRAKLRRGMSIHKLQTCKAARTARVVSVIPRETRLINILRIVSASPPACWFTSVPLADTASSTRPSRRPGTRHSRAKEPSRGCTTPSALPALHWEKRERTLPDRHEHVLPLVDRIQGLCEAIVIWRSRIISPFPSPDTRRPHSGHRRTFGGDRVERLGPVEGNRRDDAVDLDVHARVHVWQARWKASRGVLGWGWGRTEGAALSGGICSLG